jgi:hypothetical protein
LHRELPSQNSNALGGGPQDVTKVIWSRHKGGVEDPLAHFRVSGIEGVRGTHNRNHEVTKPETPFRVKVMVISVGHVELRFAPCACSHKRNSRRTCGYKCEDSSWESKSHFDSKGRLRMILRPGGQAEPTEVGVLQPYIITIYS